MPVVYPNGTVSVSSLGYFSSLGYSYKTSHYYFPVSLRVRHIKEYFKNKSGRKRKFAMSQQEKDRYEDQMK